MSTRSVTSTSRSAESANISKLLDQYGCGPIQFAGTDNALYERHLLFDSVVGLKDAGPRERFEAFARSVRDILSQRWVHTEDTYQRRNPKRVYSSGAWPQRLLWASTGTKDPLASDVLYIKALAAPFTVNTMPEGTLKALAKHSKLGAIMAADGGDCEDVLAKFGAEGIDLDVLGAQLQDQGAKSFVKSWNELMAVIASKGAALAKAG